MIQAVNPTLRVVIPGDPVPQGRGRIVRHGQTYGIKDPERSRTWKAMASTYMRLAMRSREPLTGALAVEILVVNRCPKKDTRVNTPAVRRWDIRNVGDWDNFGKALCDAGNGVLWVDDCQIVDARVRVVIGAQHEAARVEVDVVELGGAS